MGLQLSQQINLLQSEFRTQADLLCAENVQKSLIVMFSILVLVSLYDFFSGQGQARYLEELQAQQSGLEISLLKAKQTAPSMIVDSKLKQQVDGYKKDVVTKQQVLDALSGQSFGNTTGFSEFFKGLANQTVTGLWLTNLKIRSGGRDIGITGSAFKPELVPDFLNKLSDERVFQGTNFQTFRVTREENPVRVDFYVDTQFNENTQ